MPHKPRKRKNQKQNGQDNQPRPDAPSSSENTTPPATRSAREERATIKAKSNEPTTAAELLAAQYEKRAPTPGEHELGDGASWHTRNRDRQTEGVAKVDKTGDKHSSIKQDARPISSSTTNLDTSPKTKTWASVAEHGDKARTASNMRFPGLEEKKEQPSNEVQITRKYSEKKKADTIRLFEDLVKERARMLGTMKTSEKDMPTVKEARASVKARRITQVIQDRAVEIEDLKKFSKSLKGPTRPVPQDLLPILAKDRLKQEPSNDQEATKASQPLQETLKPKGQDWSEDTTLLSQSNNDGEFGLPVAAATDVRRLGTTLARPLPDAPPIYALERVAAELNALEPFRPWSSRRLYNMVEQQSFYNLQSPSMEAMQCGLGVVSHYTFPKGSFIPFQTIRNLGRGSMAHVEEVHIPHHKSFVRKTFLLTMSSDLRSRCRDIIHREVETMSRLQHIHIIQVIGSYDLEPITSTILMSPVGDNDLKMFLDELEETPLGTREGSERRSWLWKWVGCLISAVAYIHSQGICHKDIKPSNIVHKRHDVYLTDFSSCDQFNVGGTTSTGADARTTLMYRAPELFRTGDAGKHGPGTDIFALGLVFLEMKTVYWGSTIKHLRGIYDTSGSLKLASNEFYYSKALTKIHDLLSLNTTRGDGEGWPLSSQAIQSMLASERKERPSALQILDQHRLVTSAACVCTTSYSISDNRLTYSEDHQDAVSQTPDPSATARKSIQYSKVQPYQNPRRQGFRYVNPPPFPDALRQIHHR